MRLQHLRGMATEGACSSVCYSLTCNAERERNWIYAKKNSWTAFTMCCKLKYSVFSSHCQSHAFYLLWDCSDNSWCLEYKVKYQFFLERGCSESPTSRDRSM